MQTKHTAITYIFYSEGSWHGIATLEGIHHIKDPKASSLFTEKQLACPNKLSLVLH